MGNVSTQIQNVSQLIETNMSTNCENIANTQNLITNMDVTLRGVKGNCDVTFLNEAKVQQTCEMDQLADVLAEAAQGATNEQLASMSLSANVNTSKQDLKTEIKNRLQAKCGSQSDINNEISNSRVVIEPWCLPGLLFPTCYQPDCQDISFINSANTQQTCVAKQILEAQSNLTQDAKSKQTTTLFTLTIGGIAGLLVIGIIIAIIVAVTKKGKKKQGTGTGTGTGATTKTGTGATTRTGTTGGQAAPRAAPAKTGAVGGLGGFVQGGMDIYKAVGKTGGKTGGGKKRDKRFEGVPLVVLVVLALVVYGRLTDRR